MADPKIPHEMDPAEPEPSTSPIEPTVPDLSPEGFPVAPDELPPAN
jgi:hypothetical protein